MLTSLLLLPLTLACAKKAPAIVTTSLPDGNVGVAYSENVTAKGGTPPYGWSIFSGALPAGLSLHSSSSSGAVVITGTPTVAGTDNFTVRVAGKNRGASRTRRLSITISAAPVILTNSLPHGNVNAPYSQTLHAAGGTAPYTWSITSGTVPAGLSLDSSSGAITGTPTAVGKADFTAQVAGYDGATASAGLSIDISGAPAILTTALSDGDAGLAYSDNLTATGGTAPYSWSIASGTLPTGLSLDASSGAISGTPTTTGASQLAVQAAGHDGATETKDLSITINSATVFASTSLPAGNVNALYSQTLTATGGTAPYSWLMTSGALPGGLSLDSSGDVVGMPTTAGSHSLYVQVTDRWGATATVSVSISISTAPAILTVWLLNGNVNASYSRTLYATGGTIPYTWSATSGTLPIGLSLDSSSGTITGTPTAAGTSDFTVHVTGHDGATSTASLSITISAAPAITTAWLSGGDVGLAYSENLTATGGTAPYAWSITSSVTLPAGLSLDSSSGAVTGTPTAVSTSYFAVQVAGHDGATARANLFLTVNEAAVSVSDTSLPDGNVDSFYWYALAADGGSAPHTWSMTSGTLPAGLSLDSSGVITGTPTATGAGSITVQVIDRWGVTATGSVTITINEALLIITTTWVPDGNVNASYSETLAAIGGTTPYTWSITSGNMPAGLSLDSSSGAIAGTPTAAGTSDFTVQVADNDGATTTADLSITIRAEPIISTTWLSDGDVGLAYSGNLVANGGTAPYVWSITLGTLPSGLSLNSSGTITGTPTAAGYSSFTVQVAGNDGATAIADLYIVINEVLSISTTSLPDGSVSVLYFEILTPTGGTGPYTWSITAGALPTGLLLDSSGDIVGLPTEIGTYDFTVQVTDGWGATATASLSITINA
jgi:hypothetical protein